ncbi:MAG TPA: hypothetical protein VGM03_08665 [Phycisphaerae bacterium]
MKYVRQRGLGAAERLSSGAGSESLQPEHVSEAIHYRRLDRQL